MSRWAGGLVFLVAGLSSLGWFLMSQPWSGSAETGAVQKQREAFASDRDGSFDAKRAMGYLERICKIGPRISGSEGMKKQRDLLQIHFQKLGGKIELQRFTVRQKSQRQPVEMVNLIVSWRLERQRRVILCSHFDTRPIADQEPDRRKWRQPFLSANDGGSGVALLMELAHQMRELKTEVGVDFVFFDGEEYVFEPDKDVYFFGSEHFAENYRQEKPKRRYVAAVLLDMIGGKDAQFAMEMNSWVKASALVQELWKIAAEENCPAFVNQLGAEILDDHLPLNRVGIPAADIIDLDGYRAHWHRLSDVPANCSAQSLAQVARVLTAWLKKVK